MANEKRLIDANELMKVVKREYDLAMQTEHISKQGKYYENACFLRILNFIDKAPTVDAVPMAQHNELKERYKKLLETANILDAALREHQRKYGDLEE